MSTSTLTMQRPEFVSVDNTYICVYCKQVLIGPLQTRCGHRICTPCLDDLFKKNESVSCPAKEEECYVLKKDEVNESNIFFFDIKSGVMENYYWDGGEHKF